MQVDCLVKLKRFGLLDEQPKYVKVATGQYGTENWSRKTFENLSAENPLQLCTSKGLIKKKLLFLQKA